MTLGLRITLIMILGLLYLSKKSLLTSDLRIMATCRTRLTLSIAYIGVFRYISVTRTRLTLSTASSTRTAVEVCACARVCACACVCVYE